MPTLLIADDHPLFRAALRGAAADAVADLQVREAESLDGVLAVLEAEPGVDLVLLDLHMPGNHGLDRRAVAAAFPEGVSPGIRFQRALVGIGIVAAGAHGVDKSAAVNNRWRIQESTLQFVGLVGGWPGALFAQDAFRHKSRKAKFQSVFWVTVVLNCAGLAWLLATGKAAAIDQAILGAAAVGG